MELQIIISIAITIGVIFLVAKLLKNKKKIYPTVPIPDRFPTEYAIAGSPYIRSVVPVPPSAQDAVRDGILLQIEKVGIARPTWTNYRNIEDYTVYFIDPMDYNVETDPGSPALIVQGLYKSAGTCLGVGNDQSTNRPIIVLPHQAYTEGGPWNHLEYLKQSARNESEHITEWANDQTMFWQFANSGDVHPHFA